jgi:hypothetical protein
MTQSVLSLSAMIIDKMQSRTTHGESAEASNPLSLSCPVNEGRGAIIDLVP